MQQQSDLIQNLLHFPTHNQMKTAQSSTRNRVSGAIKERRMLFPGKQMPAFTNGTKVSRQIVQKKTSKNIILKSCFSRPFQLTFHFKTEYEKKGQTIVVDDSRSLNKPMELILGKEFKLQIWEELLKSMCVEEVSRFVIDKSLLLSYPHVSKIYRKFADYPIKCKLPETASSCCGSVMKSGLGYDDLDELLAEPQDLMFTFELMSVQQPDEYSKEWWQMDDNELNVKIIEFKEEGERLRFSNNADTKQIIELDYLLLQSFCSRNEGNKAYLSGDCRTAETSYLKGLALIEKLIVKHAPKTEEYIRLAELQTPFWLNLAQLKLKEKDYYAAISFCDKVLQIRPDNVKAYYRRAKAHAHVWNQENAKQDYARTVELDASMADQVTKELNRLQLRCDQVERREKESLKQKLLHFV